MMAKCCVKKERVDNRPGSRAVGQSDGKGRPQCKNKSYPRNGPAVDGCKTVVADSLLPLSVARNGAPKVAQPQK